MVRIKFTHDDDSLPGTNLFIKISSLWEKVNHEFISSLCGTRITFLFFYCFSCYAGRDEERSDCFAVKMNWLENNFHPPAISFEEEEVLYVLMSVISLWYQKRGVVNSSLCVTHIFLFVTVIFLPSFILLYPFCSLWSSRDSFLLLLFFCMFSFHLCLSLFIWRGLFLLRIVSDDDDTMSQWCVRWDMCGYTPWGGYYREEGERRRGDLIISTLVLLVFLIWSLLLLMAWRETVNKRHKRTGDVFLQLIRKRMILLLLLILLIWYSILVHESLGDYWTYITGRNEERGFHSVYYDHRCVCVSHISISFFYLW